MANTNTQTLSQTVNGGTATIVTQVTQTLTEQDILQQNQQLQYQQVQIKNQIAQLMDNYNKLATQIANNQELLAQFTIPQAE